MHARPAAALAALALALVATPAAACPYTYCVDHDSASVGVVADEDGVEVWRGGGTFADNLFCLPERVAYLLDESETDAWYECVGEPHRVV